MIGYDLSDSVQLAMGHTNGGDALRANGVDSNVKAFDKRTSQIYVDLNYEY